MKTLKFTAVLLFITLIVMALVLPAAATEAPDVTDEVAEIDNTVSAKAIAAGIAVGIACSTGALGMALAISKSAESMARQPEIAGKINSAMMLGLVFIETAIIYALIIGIIIIFVL